MAKKTFKIGECCKGGIITVEISNTIIHIIGKEWTSKKEFMKESISLTDKNAYRTCYAILTDLTTSYFADKILEWSVANSELKVEYFWK